MITRIFLDIDGVLADWSSAVCRLFDLNPFEVYAQWPPGVHEIADAIGIDNDTLWRKIDADGSWFWSSLTPYWWCHDLVHTLEAVAPVTLLTAPSRNPSSCSGKYEWVGIHLPQYERKLLIGADKAACAHPGAVLIDDRDKNCRKFRNAGGQAITFPRPWNENRNHTGDPMGYTLAELEKMVLG